MRIREAVLEDAEAIRRAHVASIKGVKPGYYTEEQITAWAENAKAHDHQSGIAKGEIIVAEVGEQIIGFGQLIPQANEVRAVYVNAAHTHREVGTKILLHLEDRARHAGLSSLVLAASLNAQTFYEKFGYQAKGRGKLQMSGNTELEYVWMEKLLAEPPVGG